MIPTILSALATSHPACSTQVLKGLLPFSQHSNHQFIQTVLCTVFLKVIWNVSLSDCIGRKFLPGQMGRVPDRLDEDNFTCILCSVYAEQVV